MTTNPIPLQEWIDAHPGALEREGEKRVIVHCECDPDQGGYDRCQGWVLTWRSAMYTYETVLTDDERASIGLPVPDPYAPHNRGIFDE